jgi:hypothetical protein
MDIQAQLKLLRTMDEGMGLSRTKTDEELQSLADAFVAARNGMSVEVTMDTVPEGASPEVLHTLIFLENRCSQVLFYAIQREIHGVANTLAPLCSMEVREQALCRALYGRCPDKIPHLHVAFGHQFRTRPGVAVDRFPANSENPSDVEVVESQTTFAVAEMLSSDWCGTGNPALLLKWLLDNDFLTGEMIDEALWLFDHMPGQKGPGEGMAVVEQWRMDQRMPSSACSVRPLRL